MSIIDVRPTAPELHDHATEPTPQTYRAAVVHEFMTPLTIEQVPRRTLETGQVLVKVEATGLAIPTSTPPTATGRSSRPRRSSRATRASASSSSGAPPSPRSPSATGSRCRGSATPAALRQLRLGLGDARLQQQNMGYSIDGTFGEYAVAYGRMVVKVPQGVDPFDAAR